MAWQYSPISLSLTVRVRMQSIVYTSGCASGIFATLIDVQSSVHQSPQGLGKKVVSWLQNNYYHVVVRHTTAHLNL